MPPNLRRMYTKGHSFSLFWNDKVFLFRWQNEEKHGTHFFVGTRSGAKIEIFFSQQKQTTAQHSNIIHFKKSQAFIPCLLWEI